MVYPGTHDNTTLTDWWENGASEKEKAAAAAYLHLTGVKPTAKELAAIRTDDVRIALLRAALGSVADRAIIPMYDWLGLGAEAHLNTPRQAGRKLGMARRRRLCRQGTGQDHPRRVQCVLPRINRRHRAAGA